MAKIKIYNNDTNRMETYYRGEQEAMPYVTGRTLTVKEFRGSSNSNLLWTEKRAMLAWNSQRYIYGKPIKVGYAFRRPWEGGHSTLSQHYAGLAFDVGQTLTTTERNNLYNSAVNSGVWTYVEPQILTPTWIHFDKRRGNPACSTGGYPQIQMGSRGAYVMIAQDDLNTLGYKTGGLDGIFGSNTQTAVRNYQQNKGLAVDGIIGCNTWRSLQEDVLGKGKTSTTID
ncbi:putative uncharacterized protein [Clostridium sp. CAG:793]|nr:putative uncharacterized protein [Clostridium sp. CAG:793]